MKRMVFTLMAVLAFALWYGCEGDTGPAGPAGATGSPDRFRALTAHELRGGPDGEPLLFPLSPQDWADNYRPQ